MNLQEQQSEPLQQSQHWRLEARCSGVGLGDVFFSEEIEDINAAKAFCQGCAVRSECLEEAIRNAEPAGVWGGQLFVSGHVVAEKRRRGRPRKTSEPAAA